jgi:hypothetical protein
LLAPLDAAGAVIAGPTWPRLPDYRRLLFTFHYSALFLWAKRWSVSRMMVVGTVIILSITNVQDGATDFSMFSRFLHQVPDRCDVRFVLCDLFCLVARRATPFQQFLELCLSLSMFEALWFENRRIDFLRTKFVTKGKLQIAFRTLFHHDMTSGRYASRDVVSVPRLFLSRRLSIFSIP